MRIFLFLHQTESLASHPSQNADGMLSIKVSSHRTLLVFLPIPASRELTPFCNRTTTATYIQAFCWQKNKGRSAQPCFIKSLCKQVFIGRQELAQEAQFSIEFALELERKLITKGASLFHLGRPLQLSKGSLH